LRKLKEKYPDDEVVLVMDRAGSHQNKTKTKAWSGPAGATHFGCRRAVRSAGPAERWFKELRARLSNRVFDSTEAIEEALTEALRPYWEDERLLRRLTGYDWWLERLENIKHHDTDLAN
jgi:hypothetical protein